MDLVDAVDVGSIGEGGADGRNCTFELDGLLEINLERGLGVKGEGPKENQKGEYGEEKEEQPSNALVELEAERRQG